MFNDRIEVHNNTTVKNYLLGSHILPWAPVGDRGGRIGVCPPPWKNKKSC